MGFKKNVSPRSWVLKGEVEFAPSLGDVHQGLAPRVYRDPDEFFKVTYVTYTMKEMLRNVASVLSGRGGAKVFPLATVFGGGKTHTLIFLHHAVKYPDKLPEGLPRPPKSNVVALDLQKLEVGPNIRGSRVVYTPWGELAYQLDSYEGLIKELDEKMIPPAEGLLIELLNKKQPLLILMDEVTHYLRRASGVKVGETTLARQTVAFLQSLLSAVNKLAQSVVVLTFPEAEAEYEKESKEVIEVVREAGHVILRIASPEQPLTKEELREIIKRWLFEEIRSQHASQVASKYFDYYKERRDAFPDEASRAEYKELIEKSYPFHPSLMDVLFERIAAIPRFQRTRGALMLLHRVLQRLYELMEDPDLIMPHHIDLSDDRIRSILLRASESEEAQKFVTIIQQDIINKEGTARAQQVDPALGPKIATCVFLSSFTLSAKDVQRVSPTAKEVALMTCKVGDNPHEVFEVLEKVAGKLHYMDEAEGRYFFRTRPGLNKLIEEYRNIASSGEVMEEIDGILQSVKGVSDISKVVWLEQEYPEDKAEYRLVISKRPLITNARISEDVKKIFEYKSIRGGEFRLNKNSLVFVTSDEEGLELAKDVAKTLVAVTNLLADVEKVVPEEYVPSYKKRLDQKKKQVLADLSSKVLAAYSYIIYPHIGEGGAVELKCEKMAMKSSIVASVEEHLEKVGKLVRRPSPRWLWDRVISKAIELRTEPISLMGCFVKAVQIKEVMAAFYEDQRLPIVPESAIRGAIREGIGDVFALCDGSKLYITEKPNAIDRNYWLLSLESAKEVLKKVEEKKEERREEKKEEEKVPGLKEVETRVVGVEVEWIDPSQIREGNVVTGIKIEDRASLTEIRPLLSLLSLPPECLLSISSELQVSGQGAFTIAYKGPVRLESGLDVVAKMDTVLRQLEAIKGSWTRFEATISGLKFKVEEIHLDYLKQIRGKVQVQKG
jgi:hypothetical protein